jgi:hypothetical protein
MFQEKGENIQTNGKLFVPYAILNIVVCSAAETQLGTLFLHIKEGKIL